MGRAAVRASKERIPLLAIFNLPWLKMFSARNNSGLGLMFTTSFVFILVQDIMMIIILALISPPPEFNNAFSIFFLIACTCLVFSQPGQRGYVDFFLTFALNSSFIVLNSY